MKQAAESIRTLVDERNEFEKKAETQKIATSIIESMVEKEMLSTEEVLPKLAELKDKSDNELLIMQEALKLGNASGLSKLGELSDRADSDGMTPEEKFIHGTIGDLL